MHQPQHPHQAAALAVTAAAALGAAVGGVTLLVGIVPMAKAIDRNTRRLNDLIALSYQGVGALERMEYEGPHARESGEFPAYNPN